MPRSSVADAYYRTCVQFSLCTPQGPTAVGMARQAATMVAITAQQLYPSKPERKLNGCESPIPFLAVCPRSQLSHAHSWSIIPSTTPTLQGIGDTLFARSTTFTRRVRHLSRRPKPDAVRGRSARGTVRLTRSRTSLTGTLSHTPKTSASGITAPRVLKLSADRHALNFPVPSQFLLKLASP
jgi:hypothetical protein